MHLQQKQEQGWETGVNKSQMLVQMLCVVTWIGHMLPLLLSPWQLAASC
jgi:hypothetical protein